MNAEARAVEGQIVTTNHKPKLVERLASRFGVDADKFLHTLKQTAFRVPPRWDRDEKALVAQEVTNEQMMALLVVAEQYKLNPFTKEIFAFPDKANGVVPIVGVDGWSRIINDHDQLDGIEFRWSESTGKIDEHHKPCPDWCEAVIYRKDRSRPVVAREYLDECYRPPFMKNGNVISGPWQTHTKRFLRHKALIQCARIAFGFAGIYDQDEGERILEGQIVREEKLRDVGVSDINHTLREQAARRAAQLDATSESGGSAKPKDAPPAENNGMADSEGMSATDDGAADAAEPLDLDGGEAPRVALVDVLRMVDHAKTTDDLDVAEDATNALTGTEQKTARGAVAKARERLA